MKTLTIHTVIDNSYIATKVNGAQFGKNFHSDFEVLGLMARLPDVLRDKIKQIPDDDETDVRELLIQVKVDEFEDKLIPEIKAQGFGIGIRKELEIQGIIESLPDIQKQKIKNLMLKDIGRKK